ncbi:MAG: hypothetical protein U1E00_05635 [Pseudoxanthomonas sp.]|nr:hypothetical protein [Pseudoxanthomonas sp.]
MGGVGKNPGLAELERQLEAQRRAFLAEADLVDPRTATDEEVRALDAKALPLNELTHQIRMLRPISRLRSELERTRLMEREVAGSDAERALYRKNGDELEALLAQRLVLQAAERRRLGLRLGAVGLVVVGAFLAWWLLG